MPEEELRQVFQVHGSIQDIHMVRDRRNQESKGRPLYIEYHPHRQGEGTTCHCHCLEMR